MSRNSVAGQPVASGVPLAKKPAGTLRVRVFGVAHAAAGIFLEVVNAKTADCAVHATRLAKGIVMETAVMLLPLCH